MIKAAMHSHRASNLSPTALLRSRVCPFVDMMQRSVTNNGMSVHLPHLYRIPPYLRGALQIITVEPPDKDVLVVVVLPQDRAFSQPVDPISIHEVRCVLPMADPLEDICI